MSWMGVVIAKQNDFAIYTFHSPPRRNMTLGGIMQFLLVAKATNIFMFIH